MKYLPLVWAAIMRKPTRAVLTLLSVMVAFTLFGMMIGMNATFAGIEEAARADRIFVNPRFNNPLPIAEGRQIAAVPGVLEVATIGFIPGYHQDKKNNVFVMMVDDKNRIVRADWPLKPADWDLIAKNRTGLVVSRLQAQKWNLKVGSSFVVNAPAIAKADGTRSWTFNVVSIVDDMPAWGDGYMMGNLDYFDKSRPLADQGQIGWFEILAKDPEAAPALAQQIDQSFASSAAPLQSITEKAAYQANGSGIDIASVTRDIALAGLFMILFLTANGIAQSVRERFAEFATLKTIGFSDRAVLILVVLEAALPCAVGAVLGVGVAGVLAKVLPRFIPPGFGLPMPTMTAMVFVWAAISAVIVALASSALPAMRLAKMDIATALSGRT
jgi:putative ABC transport system permease protein